MEDGIASATIMASTSFFSSLMSAVTSVNRRTSASTSSVASPSSPPSPSAPPRRRHGPRPPPSRPVIPAPPMSTFSSPPVPNSGFSSENFMLGAGMVIIQPATHRIVVVYDTKSKDWFLPRGRKDVGESLEETALREAYEETGYRATPLPLFAITHAPAPPSDPDARYRLITEPLYTTLSHWQAGRGNRRLPGEYMTFWYAGQIPHDAMHTPITTSGMPDEQNYTSHLLTYRDAIDRLKTTFECKVVAYVWATYCETLEIVNAQLQEERERQRETNRENEADESRDNGRGASEENERGREGTSDSRGRTEMVDRRHSASRGHRRSWG